MNLRLGVVEIMTPHDVVVLCTTVSRTTADICSPTSSIGFDVGFELHLFVEGEVEDALSDGEHAINVLLVESEIGNVEEAWDS